MACIFFFYRSIIRADIEVLYVIDTLRINCNYMCIICLNHLYKNILNFHLDNFPLRQLFAENSSLRSNTFSREI